MTPHFHGFGLEVLFLYSPGLGERDQLRAIAHAKTDAAIPFTILAFFPEYRMKTFRSPTAQEMVQAYEDTESAGLRNATLGTPEVFIRSKKRISNCSRSAPRRAPSDLLGASLTDRLLTGELF